MPPLAIFFDLDDTLLDHRGAERAGAMAMHARHRAGPDEGEDAFCTRWRAAAERHYARYAAGAITFADQRRERLRDVLARRLSDVEADQLFADYLTAYRAAWRAFADVGPGVATVRARHPDAVIGVLTNGEAEQQAAKLARIGLTGQVAHLVTPADAGGRGKPGPAIFAAAARICGVPGGRCVMVGDDLALDVAGARAAGWRAIWLDRRGERVDGGAADAIIGSLLDLAPLIPR